MPPPLRVCLVSPLPPPMGGIARWTDVLHRHVGLLPDLELSVVDTSLRWRSIHQTAPMQRVLAGIPQLFSAVWDFYRVMATSRPDVVHINTSGQLGVVRDLLIAKLARFFRVPFVYHLRFGRTPLMAERNGLEWRMMSRVMRVASAVIALDGPTEETIGHRLPEVRVLRIPNFVDCATLPDPLPIANGPKVVLFVGWVVRAKGIEELLTAWSSIDTTGWNLQVAGSYDSAYLDSVAVRKGPFASASFLGPLPHARVLELMAACDLFVLPSHSEGFPNAVLEAMALGRAVVSTDVGAVGEMLSHDCGVLVAPHRTDELAAALGALMSDERRRSEIGQRARGRATSEYSVEPIVKRYVSLWSDVSKVSSHV
jgi:glycosyltransferase involved in cell wall biosynthesis